MSEIYKSQDFLGHRVHKRHVFGALDGQLADRIILNHLGNAVKRLTELAEDELPVAIHDDLHVHITLGTSEILIIDAMKR